MTTPRLHCPTLVLGDTAEASEYCARKALPLIAVINPHRYAYFDTDKEGNFFLETLKRNKFFLSLSGLLLGGPNIQNVQIDQINRVVEVFSSGGLVLRVTYEDIIIFDEHGISGLTPQEMTPPIYRVIDIYQSLKRQDREITFTLENLKNEYFEKTFLYTSERSPKVKDIVSVCHLTEKQLSGDYSESMVRMYMNRVADKVVWDTLGYKTVKPRIRHVYRITSRINRDIYVPDEHTSYDFRTLEEIKEQEEVDDVSYIRKVEFYLCREKLRKLLKVAGGSIVISPELFLLSQGLKREHLANIRRLYNYLITSLSPKEP